MKKNSDDRNGLMTRFEDSLNHLAGPRNYDLSMVGDLDDLLFTLEKTAGILRSIARDGSLLQVKDLRARLIDLKIQIEEDLPLIFTGLLPALDQLLETTLEDLESEKSKDSV